MMRLLLVELRRYRSRRAVRALGIVAVVAIAFAGFMVFITAKTEDDFAGVVPQQSQLLRDCIDFYDSPEGQGQLPPGFDSPRDFCKEQVVESIHEVDPRFRLTDLTEILAGTTVPLIIIGLFLGATFIGAEWNAGTVATSLTWEPRRINVHVIKILAAAIFVFVASMALQVLLGLAMLPTAAWKGTTEGADAAWLAEVAGLVWRGGAIAALAAVIGFSIASVARNTAAAVGIGFVYLAVLEGLIRGFKPHWQPWLLGDNAAAFIVREDIGVGHSAGVAGLVVVGYALAFLTIATLMFKTRDVGS